jgi:hypothetical protein
MRELTWTAIVIGIACVSSAGERPQLRGAETPRATDLLRAERLAEKADEWRRLPARKFPGWLKGGAGWTGTRGPSRETPRVTVRVAPPRRPRESKRR